MTYYSQILLFVPRPYYSQFPTFFAMWSTIYTNWINHVNQVKQHIIIQVANRWIKQPILDKQCSFKDNTGEK